MVPFEKHIFVCTSGKVCPVNGNSVAVHSRLKELVRQAGLESFIRINQAGCMGQCGNGPMVVVYPDNIWYCGVKIEDADAILEDHIRGGHPIERLLYHPAHPGINKR